MKLCGKQSINGLPMILITSEYNTIEECLDELTEMAYAITSIEHKQKYERAEEE